MNSFNERILQPYSVMDFYIEHKAPIENNVSEYSDIVDELLNNSMSIARTGETSYSSWQNWQNHNRDSWMKRSKNIQLKKGKKNSTGTARNKICHKGL